MSEAFGVCMAGSGGPPGKQGETPPLAGGRISSGYFFFGWNGGWVVFQQTDRQTEHRQTDRQTVKH